MKKLLALSLILLSTQSMAYMTYFSDGSWAETNGNMTYYSDNSWSQRSGNTFYNSDGTSATWSR